MMGIYRIRNIKNGCCYIGSSKDIQQRWHVHRSALQRGNHPTRRLQRAWLKYGSESFAFELVEEVIDEAALLPREAQAMSEHRLLYNKTIMDVERMRKRQAAIAARAAQAEHRGKLIAMMAERVPDAKAMIFPYLDCGELFHLEGEVGEVRVRAIEPDEVAGIKRRYVERHLPSNWEQELTNILFGAGHRIIAQNGEVSIERFEF